MPRTSTTSRSAPRRPARPRTRVVGQSISPVPPSSIDDLRPVDLEVVVVLGVERGHRLGVPDLARGARPRRWRRRRRRSSPRTRRSAPGRQVGQAPAVLDTRSTRYALAGAVPERRPHVPLWTRRAAADDARARRLGTHSTSPRARAGSCARPCAERVVVADGAMGTMLQAHDPTLDDFAGPRGLQRDPQRHPAGHRPRASTTPTSRSACDCVETNTFGANLANLGEYGIADRIHELAEAGARLAREVADGWSHAGPPALGARLGRARAPSCRPSATSRTPTLRDAYAEQVAGLLAGGADALLVETAQDLLQTKAAVIGARRAMAAAGVDVAADRPGHRRDHRHDAARLARSAPRSPRSSRSAST